MNIGGTAIGAGIDMRFKLLCAFSLLLALGTAPEASAQTHVTIAMGGKTSLGFLPVTVALQRGYFKEQGIDLEIADFAGGPKSVEALIGGSVEFAAAVFDYPLTLQAKDVNLVNVVILTRGHGNVIALRKDLASKYKDPKDLKGMKVGVTAPGSATADWFESFIVPYGLTLKDVSVVGVGGGAGAVSAMKAGQIDVISAVDPVASRLLADGDVIALADTRNPEGMKLIFGGDIAGSSVFTTSKVITDKPKMVQGFVTGVVKALKWMSSVSTEELVESVPTSYYVGSKAEYIEMINKNRVRYLPTGRTEPEAADRNVKFLLGLKRRGPMTPSELSKTYDNSFVDAAVKALGS